MKNDNRIFRPESLTEEQARDFASGVNAYLERQHQRDAEREAEIKRKITSGEYIEKDGKLYDARYYKGGTNAGN